MPIFIQWGNTYSVSVQEMDRHHNQFVTCLNELYAGLTENKPFGEIEIILEEFYSYAQFHFTAEEKLLAIHNYPQLAEQKAQHQHYIRKIASYKRLLYEQREDIVHEALTFFKDWFLEHVQKTDKQYSTFLNEHGVH